VLNCLVLRRGLGGCVRFVQGDFCEATTAHPHLTHSAHAFVSQVRQPFPNTRDQGDQ
jgi:hypothetical protein